MNSEYFLIKKAILPDYFGKVVEAKRLLETEKVSDVSAAAKRVGISRSTYYKYKDMVFEPSEMAGGQKAVLSVMLDHSPGMLSRLLLVISDSGANVLTINQSLPIHGEADVTFSLDVSGMKISVSELMALLAACPGAKRPKILAIE